MMTHDFAVFMRFSVLIPTYKRKAKLQVVLKKLSEQPDIAEGEVVVGIDGSEDGTLEMLESMKADFPGQLVFFWISNSGRAVIRNHLIEKAGGELLIFIQDDIVVSEGWLKAHLDFHDETQGALVGHMTWYPQGEISPYMKWLESGGHMLRFDGYSTGDEMDFWHFYMGNISVPRDMMGKLRFDEDMKIYGWEDIMMGVEFVRQGYKVFYSAEALAYHWDEYREEDLKSYMNHVGKSAVLAEKKYPGTGFVPPLWKRNVFRLLIFFGLLFSSFLPQTWRWYLDMKKWFLQAVDEA